MIDLNEEKRKRESDSNFHIWFYASKQKVYFAHKTQRKRNQNSHFSITSMKKMSKWEAQISLNWEANGTFPRVNRKCGLSLCVLQKVTNGRQLDWEIDINKYRERERSSFIRVSMVVSHTKHYKFKREKKKKRKQKKKHSYIIFSHFLDYVPPFGLVF